LTCQCAHKTDPVSAFDFDRRSNPKAAHRPAPPVVCGAADKVHLLDMGNVVEQGTYTELVTKMGLYAVMHVAQKKGYS